MVFFSPRLKGAILSALVFQFLFVSVVFRNTLDSGLAGSVLFAVLLIGPFVCFSLVFSRSSIAVDGDGEVTLRQLGRVQEVGNIEDLHLQEKRATFFDFRVVKIPTVTGPSGKVGAYALVEAPFFGSQGREEIVDLLR